MSMLRPDDSSLPAFANQANLGAQILLEQFASDSEITELRRQVAIRLTIEEGEAATAAALASLTLQLYDHVHRAADSFKSRAYERVAAPGRSEAAQADLEHFNRLLQSDLNSHLRGILEVGVTAMARVANQPIVLPPPPPPPPVKKKGWFR